MEKAKSLRDNFTFAFRALHHRNYRLFFFGQIVSLIGTWISRVAVGWLVYRLTDSALWLGLVSFAGMIPTFLLTPLGGIVADRFSRHRILVITQLMLMLSALALAYFTLSDSITITHMLVLGGIQGLCNAFDIPARQAFVVDMVDDRDDLSSAIAMNSMVFNSARLLGPSVAGLLIAVFSEGVCFLIDGVSFIAVVTALLAMRVPPFVPHKQHPNVTEELRDGLRASFGFVPIRAILLLTALTSLVGMPYAVLMPIFADDVLHGDSVTLGFLMAASGVGALIGALLLAMRPSVLGLGRYISRGAGLFGLSLVFFGMSHWLWLSLLMLVATGFFMMIQTAASNTVVQTIVDDKMRGRVMGFFAMAFLGTMPFGSLLAGALARRIGAPETIIFGGLVCFLGSMLFARQLPKMREYIRPIYRERGILPPLPEGVGSAAGLLPSEEEVLSKSGSR